MVYELQNIKLSVFQYTFKCELSSPQSPFRPFLSPPKRNPLPSISHCPFPHPSCLATTDFISVFMHLPVLDISHKWNPTTSGLSWLTSFIEHNVFKASPCGMFLLLCDIALSHLCHKLLIHSSTKGHLDCFQLFAITLEC